MGLMNYRSRALVLAASLMASTAIHAQVNVTTYHNDNARTGQNTQESILTPANVNSKTFGKLFSVPLDGRVYAQPLYMSAVPIHGGTHNVIYAATEHDSVYAIDADTGAIYWQKSLIPAGATVVNSGTDLACGDITTEVGITGTPVIDPNTGTLYVVSKTKLNGIFSQHLHALDIGTAIEKFGGPTDIHASVPGIASDSVNGALTFNVKSSNNRPALLLENGHVIIGWASHCDRAPWHGWVMSYNASTLTQEAAYSASGNGFGNGVWMSAAGMASDAGGNIYFSTGNGSWNGTTDLGDSVVKLGPPAGGKFPIADYFTPWNQNSLEVNDNDLSAGGVVLLPTTAAGKQMLTMIGKEGKIYLLDRNNLGKYCVIMTPACGTSDPQIVQEIPNAISGLWGAPAYWNGHVYWGGGNDDTNADDSIKAFSFDAGGSGKMSLTPTSVTVKKYGFSGPVPSISSSGTTNGILWAADNHNHAYTCSGAVHCQTLIAYDSTNLAHLLYTSDDAPNARDVPGGALKFTTPTVANGKVYTGTQEGISGYGLLNGVQTASAPVFSPGGATYTSTQSVTLTDSTAGAAIYYTTDGSTPTTASKKYGAAVAIAATTTVKAIAVATGFANSLVASASYTIAPPATGTGGAVAVNLGVSATVHGIFADGSPTTNGGIDGLGFAYSGNLLGTSLTWSGSTFALTGAGAADAATSVTLTLPAGNYATLNLLGTGVRGNQQNQSFVVTYTDGTTTTFVRSLSDWFAPQHYAGETIVSTMAHRVTGNGASGPGPFYLYGYSFALNGGKTLKSLTLPANRNVVVLGVSLLKTATPPPTTPPPPGTTGLGAVANVHGIWTNGSHVANGGADGLGYAYSETLLGSTLTWGGSTFTLGAANAVDAASSVTLSLPAGNYAQLNVLATAVRSSQANQAFVVTYTDGTTTTGLQSLSDWFTPQNFAGESKASTMAYRVNPDGTTGAGPYYLYGYSFAIDKSKTVKTLTLPANKYVVVFGVALAQAAATTPPATAAQVDLSSTATVYGLFNDGSPVTNGGLDGLGYGYSKNLLGASLTTAGTTFKLEAVGAPTAATGRVVALPAGKYASLHMLGTGLRGSQLNQQFIVTYTDGTTTSATQSLSDWFAPQNFAGESKASSMAYRVAANGSKDPRPFYLYGYLMPINSAKTVKSLTLPANRAVVVLGLTLSP